MLKKRRDYVRGLL